MKYGESEMSILDEDDKTQCKRVECWWEPDVSVRERGNSMFDSSGFMHNIMANLARSRRFPHDGWLQTSPRKFAKFEYEGRNSKRRKQLWNHLSSIHDVIDVYVGVLVHGCEKIVLSSMGVIPCWLVDLYVRAIFRCHCILCSCKVENSQR